MIIECTYEYTQCDQLERPSATRATRTPVTANTLTHRLPPASRCSARGCVIGLAGLLRPAQRALCRPHAVSARRAVRSGTGARRRLGHRARRRSRSCSWSACRTCRFTCASTRCRASSCSCSAPPRRASRFSAPATSAAARARRPGLLCLQYHLFLASMGFVLLADDAYAFMVAWETMALSSYFLVTTQHRIPEIRSAGLSVPADRARRRDRDPAVLRRPAGRQLAVHLRRDARRARSTRRGPSIAFLLALFGFGAKAGLVPLHVWLPEAHPAAPSPVSALMSGVMLKTALYGMLRVTFDLLGEPVWWWGLVPLAARVVHGAVRRRVRGRADRHEAAAGVLVDREHRHHLHGRGSRDRVRRRRHGCASASLALIAVLYHALNHAFMKSLLFLGTGAVLHATGERNLGRLGGLIHRMPWVAWLTLVGALAIAGLPPLNGFVSEWLLLQAFLFAHEVPQPFVEHAAAARRGAARARCRARRLRHGQVLRRDLPRSAA